MLVIAEAVDSLTILHLLVTGLIESLIEMEERVVELEDRLTAAGVILQRPPTQD